MNNKTQLKKIMLENESLRHRLDNFEDGTKLSMANMSSMISDKGKDLNDMKWKLNDALELKRRTETDKDTMVFELENLRARYVADLKEKYLLLTKGLTNGSATKKLGRHDGP